MSTKKSKDFDRNLNSKTMSKQIEKNLFKASSILMQTSNAIAPIDTGMLRNNTKRTDSGLTSTVIWQQPYAGKVYNVNYKNPQTKFWIRKGYQQKRVVLQKIAMENVVI